MRAGSSKSAQIAKWKAYADIVCLEDAAKQEAQRQLDSGIHSTIHLNPKNESAWDAARELGCPPVSIGGKTYPHFSYVLGRCGVCRNKWTQTIEHQALRPDLEDRATHCLLPVEIQQEDHICSAGGSLLGFWTVTMIS